MRHLSPYSYYSPSPEAFEILECETPLTSNSGASSPWLPLTATPSTWPPPAAMPAHLLRDNSPFVGYPLHPRQSAALEDFGEATSSIQGWNHRQGQQRNPRRPDGVGVASESRLGEPNLEYQFFPPSSHNPGVDYPNGLHWQSPMAQVYGITPNPWAPSSMLNASRAFVPSYHSPEGSELPSRGDSLIGDSAVRGPTFSDQGTVQLGNVQEGVETRTSTPVSSRYDYASASPSAEEAMFDELIDTTYDENDAKDEKDEKEMSNDVPAPQSTEEIVAAIKRSKDPLENTHNICFVCGVLFTRRHNLTMHLDTHNPHRTRYPCKSCSLSFTRPKDRDRHVITVHDKSCKYKCDCGRGFPRKDSLQRHILTGCEGASPTPRPGLEKPSPSPSPARRNPKPSRATEKAVQRRKNTETRSNQPQNRQLRPAVPPAETTNRTGARTGRHTVTAPRALSGRAMSLRSAVGHDKWVNARDQDTGHLQEVEGTDSGEEYLDEEDDAGGSHANQGYGVHYAVNYGYSAWDYTAPGV